MRQVLRAGRRQLFGISPPFIQTTGTAVYAPALIPSPAPFRDSPGQTASTRVTLTGRKTRIMLDRGSLITCAAGRLATGGNSCTTMATNGCVATVWRDGPCFSAG